MPLTAKSSWVDPHSALDNAQDCILTPLLRIAVSALPVCRYSEVAAGGIVQTPLDPAYAQPLCSGTSADPQAAYVVDWTTPCTPDTHVEAAYVVDWTTPSTPDTYAHAAYVVDWTTPATRVSSE